MGSPQKEKLKLPKQQIQIKFKSRAPVKLVFVALLFFHLTIFSQKPTVKSDAGTAANLPTKVAPPIAAPPKQSPTLSDQSKSSAPTLITEKLVHGGDILDIDILGSLENDWRGKTDDEGFLSELPNLNVSIFALCRTEDELAREITVAYSKILRNPTIVVRVVDRSERQPAILLGAVKVSQRFQIQRPARLDELIIMSGGITDNASGEVNIFRPAHASCVAPKRNQAESQFINVKLIDLLSGITSANPQVRTGDLITVETAAPVYVTGGVIAPQRILFRQGMSVSRAIASTGGLSRNAIPSKTIVYRRKKTGSDLEIIEIDFEKVAKQETEDILLQAYDIVEISQAGQRRTARSPVIKDPETKQFDPQKLPLRSIN